MQLCTFDSNKVSNEIKLYFPSYVHKNILFMMVYIYIHIGKKEGEGVE